jgi:hypothetical protein
MINQKKLSDRIAKIAKNPVINGFIQCNMVVAPNSEQEKILKSHVIRLYRIKPNIFGASFNSTSLDPLTNLNFVIRIF